VSPGSVQVEKARGPAALSDRSSELVSYTEHPAVVYEHIWRPGDFLAWDNLSSAHARTDFSPAERRLLLRGTTVGDYRPVAAS